MNTNHTPAPWQYLIADRGYIITNHDSSYDIAIVRNVAQRFDNKANARLIATAPELLEALKNLKSAFIAHTQWNGEPINEVAIANALIAKVTGEQA